MTWDVLKNSIPILEFCEMQNQVWMIEFSYECDSMLHNAWLDIPYVFLLFIEMISDTHTWRRLIWFTHGQELVVRWAGPFLVLSFSLQHSGSCMIFSRQPLLWFMLILGWWVVYWRCKRKFLLDYLAAWQRVVLLCFSVIHQSSLWSKKEPHWYLYERFISMT